MKGNLYTENEKVIKTFIIGKSKYKVYSCKVLKFRKNNYIGFVDYDRKEIFLKINKHMKESLMHELTHIFINEILLKKKIKNKKIIKKLRSYEPFIDSLSFLIEQNFKLK